MARRKLEKEGERSTPPVKGRLKLARGKLEKEGEGSTPPVKGRLKLARGKLEKESEGSTPPVKGRLKLARGKFEKESEGSTPPVKGRLKLARGKLEKEGEGSASPVKGRLKLAKKPMKKALRVKGIRGGGVKRTSPLIKIENGAAENSKGQNAKASTTSKALMEPERTGSETESDDNTKRRRAYERTETPTEKDIEGYEIAYVKNFMTSVKDLPEDGIRHITQLVQLGWDTQGLVRSMEVAMTKLLGEDGIESELDDSPPDQAQCLRELEELLMLASEVGDNRAARSDELNNIIDDNCHSLFIEKKKLDDALEAKDCARRPKPRKRIKPSIISNNSGRPANKKIVKPDETERVEETFEPVATFDSGQRDDINDSGQREDINDSGQRDGTNDSGQRDDINDSGQRDGTNDSGQRDGTNDSGQRDDMNDSGQRDDINDSGNRSSSGSDSDSDSPPYCICGRGSFGRMVGCDNDLCPIEWFHFRCVKLSVKPMGSWYCPRCRGKNSRVMKSKQVFLQELEQYNIEEEKKCEKYKPILPQ